MRPLFAEPLTERARRGPAPRPTAARPLALHAQGTRRPACDVAVAFLPAPGGACVARVPRSAAAAGHVRGLWDHYDALGRWTDALATPSRALYEDAAGLPVVVEAWLDASSYESSAARALERGDVAGAANVLGDFRAALERAATGGGADSAGAFAAALGPDAAWRPGGTERWLPGCALDLMPHNLLRTPGRPSAIDLEWAFPAPLPVAFLAARALLVFARREGGLLVGNWRQAGVPLLDLGGGERLPAELCGALVGGPAEVDTWLPLVRRHEATLQRVAAWRAPWAAPEPPAGSASSVRPSAPHPLELLGWTVLRERIRQEHEALGRLEAENARLRRDLAFTAVGLARRAARRLPWLGRPVRAAYHTLLDLCRG
jgi:hypothetical protein